MKPRMVISGNYGARNLGDDAILRALIEEFGTKYQISVMSANPSETEREYGVNAIWPLPTGIRSILKYFLSANTRKAIKETKRTIKKANVFLLGGGTLLTDIPWRSLPIWKTQVNFAFKNKVPVWIYRSGIGPLTKAKSKAAVREILRKSEKISVRDTESFNCVKQLGIKDVEIQKDPVIAFPIKFETKHKETNEVIIVPRKPKTDHQIIKQSIVKFIDHLSDQGDRITLVSFDQKWPHDKEFIRDIYESCQEKKSIEIWNDYEGEKEVLTRFQSAKCIISMRLHALIFAEQVKTPWIGLDYMQKIHAFASDQGRSNQILYLNNLSGEQLTKHYNSVSKEAFKRDTKSSQEGA